MERRILAVAFVMLILSVVFADVVRAQSPPKATPCHISPDEFAVKFFRDLEVAPLSWEIYDVMFASEFKSGTSYQQLQDFVSSTHKRFGIDRFDKPIEARLVKPPSVDRLSSKRGELEFSVRLSAFTSRGKSQQRVDVICEKDVWKVMRFSYEPEKD